MKQLINRIFRKFGYKVINMNFRERDGYTDQFILMGDHAITIFDVGACTGSVTSKYLDIFKRSTIYSIEPFKPSFDILQKTMAGSGRVKVFNVGLSNISGIAEFFVNESAATNSMLAIHPDSGKNWNTTALNTTGKIQIDTITLDDFMTQNNVDKIDILKLDTQGTEYQVLEGARQAMKANNISLIYLEIITKPTYEGQKNLDEILLFLRNSGFELYNFYDSSYNSNGELRQLDAIFVNKEHPLIKGESSKNARRP